MTKWEYKIIAIDPMNPEPGGEAALNGNGSEGWEVAESFFGKDGVLQIILKRPVSK